jgi:hypothetical protein
MRMITTRIIGFAAIALFAMGSADPAPMVCCFNPGNPHMACCSHGQSMACCRPHLKGMKHHMA